MHLLLIEDPLGASEMMVARLSQAGFRTSRVQSPREALSNVNSERAQVILIDQHKAGQPASALVKPLRDGGLHQPLIVLSPNFDWRDKVDTLNAGADDFVTKPIRSEEVAARLRAVIRRNAGQASDRIMVGGLDIDLREQCAWLGGKCLGLTRNEFRLLRALALSPSLSANRNLLRQALGLNGAGLTDNAVDVQVGRLRRKIGADLIRTIRGVGYQLVAAASESRSNAPERDPCRKSTSCDCETGSPSECSDKGDALSPAA